MKVFMRNIAISFVLSLFGVASLCAQNCQELQKATSVGLLHFLNRDVPSDRSAECVAFAIKTLGDRHYEPARSVLTRFLDFRRPPTDEEKVGVITFHTFYPATNALAEIGKACLPNLLKVVESGSASAKARENAVTVWMTLHENTPEGVASLKRAAMERTAPSAKGLLDWAASNAVQWCGPGDMPKCRAAAKTGYPD